jgi:hypothetical protein
MVQRRIFDPETGELIEENPDIVGAEEALETDESIATPETQPFRFTQNALSGQATGAAGGIDTRTPIARSPALGAGAYKSGGMILGLPTRAATFGSGDDVWSGNVFDTSLIARQMGISPERHDELMGMQRTGEGPIEGLSDEEALLRGIGRTYADPRTNTMQAFTARKSKAAGEDTASLMLLGRGGRVIDPTRLTKEQYETKREQQETFFKKQGQQEGDGTFGNIMKSIAMAIPAVVASVVTYGAATPYVAPWLAGAAAGAAGGLTSGLTQGALAGDMDFKSIAQSTGLGAAGGAVTGGLAGAMGGAGASTTQAGATGPFSAIGSAPQGISSGLTPAHMSGMYGGLGLSTAQISELTNAGLMLAPPVGGATAGGLTGAFGYDPEASLLRNVGNVVSSPGAKLIGKGVTSGIQQTAAQSEMRQAQAGALGQAVAPLGAQAQAAGLTRRQQQKALFQENPFYDPIEDFSAGQSGVV